MAQSAHPTLVWLRALFVGNRDLHATIRAKTVAEMRRNAAQWRNYLPGDGPPDRRYKQYCDRMGVAGCYVEGNLEVFAAATANNVRLPACGQVDLGSPLCLCFSLWLHTYPRSR